MNRKQRRRRSQGAVSLEFLIAFPSLWVFCLCVFQLVLLARADLMVRHAADAAARSASVVLPDDPSSYDGESEMSVASGAIDPEDRSRRETIELAGQFPLLALGSAPFQRARRRSLRSSIGSTSFVEALTSMHSGFALAFPDASSDVVGGPEVTVRVTLAYPCEVPIARHIVCAATSNVEDSRAPTWRFDHSATLLIHDAPYRYRSGRES